MVAPEAGVGGAASSGGSVGAGGTVDADASAGGADGGGAVDGVGVAGEPCPGGGTLACAGQAQKYRLRCDPSGSWIASGECPTGSLCETASGTNQGLCRPIAEGCEGKKPRDVTCDPGGKVQVTCGVNLTTSVRLTCAPGGSCDDGKCKCDAGYAGDGFTCDDVNECETENGGCDVNARCQNETGSRSCTCNAGYTGDGTTCSDVDECVIDNGGCDLHATCTNVAGGRTCACNAGWTGDGETCTDVDECGVNNGGCSVNANCVSTAGSFQCTCKTGFTGDGFTCTDVNECATANGGCSTNATCTNTPGSRTCTCTAGFTGNGVTCADVDECATGNGGCSSAATCTNTAPGRTCACKAGYTGDGIVCNDVDECASNNGGCASRATCTNTEGGRSCACVAGWTGDGVTCGPNCGVFAKPAGGDAYDTRTGKYWRFIGIDYRFKDAQAACAALGSGWHLPSIDELTNSVIAGDPAMSPCVFTISTTYPCGFQNESTCTRSVWSNTIVSDICNQPNPASCPPYQAYRMNARTGAVDQASAYRYPWPNEQTNTQNSVVCAY